MTATVYGRPGPEPGDQRVYEALHYLPDDAIVYAQPKLVYRNQTRNPDYVIVYAQWGVIVLEVKDWTDIQDADGRHAYLLDRKTGEQVEKTSPVEQARIAAQVLSDMLKEDSNLRSYAGKLDFSYAYGGVLPLFPTSRITWLERFWGKGYVLGKSDLHRQVITERIAQINPEFRRLMTEAQVRAVCAILDELNKNCHAGQFRGVYDRVQESLAKEQIAPPSSLPVPQKTETTQAKLDLGVAAEAVKQGDTSPSSDTVARPDYNASIVPAEVDDLVRAPHVRLVRGFAGTGKTDVLILRARWLRQEFPDLRILVTTFNKPVFKQRLKPEIGGIADVETFDTICAEVYKKKHGRWVEPQDTLGLVRYMTDEFPNITNLGAAFLAEEFIWMKETGRTQRDKYVTEQRLGRAAGGGRRLSAQEKKDIFALFEAYEARLGELPAHDWVDLHEKTLRYLREGVQVRRPYDAILVDEGQHLAPTWVKILLSLLKPAGTFFICDDPQQSQYRYYSWRQKGIDVVGRTRWLRVPYRNTREIFRAAYALIEDDPLAKQLLADDGESAGIPDIDAFAVRSGPRPEAHRFGSWEAERQFVSEKVRSLITEGIPPQQIAVFHEKSYVLNRYRNELPAGVVLAEPKKHTGTEYHAVLMPKVQEMLDESTAGGIARYESRQRLKFYMTMCRARQEIYLLYEQRWPKPLEAIQPHVAWINHG